MNPSITNAVIDLAQNHYWGEGSDWFWTFGQFVFALVQVLVVPITLFFIWRQVKLQTEQTAIEAKSHILQSVCTIQDYWISETMQRARHDVCNRWKDGTSDFDGACDHIANFFEELGTFAKIKAIPNETIWDVWSWDVEHYWHMFEEGILKVRKEYNECVFCEFEELYKTMRTLSKGRGLEPVDEPCIKKFIKREIKMTTACLDLMNKSKR